MSLQTFPSAIQEYTLKRQLGRGAFGTVFEGEVISVDSVTGQSTTTRVAIKILDKKAIRAQGMAARVRNEVSIHFQLRHENILELLHFFEDSQYVYLVMELAREGELYQRVKLSHHQQQPSVDALTEEQVGRLFYGIVRGLLYLHSHGIIHRDLKLSNVLLDCRVDARNRRSSFSSMSLAGQAGDEAVLVPKICDFGLAVRTKGVMCEQKTLCGTPNYLAPEVIRKEAYGCSADLWSLGCMLYTMLVGRPPFESTAGNLRETFGKVQKADFMIPTSISADAADLVSRLIVLDPDQRLSLLQAQVHPFVQRTVHHQNSSTASISMHSPLVNRHLNSMSSVGPFSLNQPRSNNTNQLSMSHQQLVMNNQSMMSMQSSNVDNRPLNASNLPPIRQGTRRGLVEITDDGRVIVDFTSVSDVVVISTDGRLVEIYQRPFYQFDAARSKLVAQFNWCQIPWESVKARYEYARRFVSLVRSKTPAIIVYEGNLRLSLWDCSVADQRAVFQMRWDTGERVEIVSAGGGSQRQASLVVRFADSDAPVPDHMQRECWQRYEQLLKLFEERRPLLEDRPLIVRQDQLLRSSDQARFVENASDSFECVHRVFVPNLGWCLASASEQFLLLFTDGYTVLVDGPRNRVAFAPPGSAVQVDQSCFRKPQQWYNLSSTSTSSSGMPWMLRDKLNHFPVFLQQLRAGQSQSFMIV